MTRKRSRPRKRLTGPIHERLVRLRTSRNLTQDEVARHVEVDVTAVSHWENKIARPDIDRIPVLASLFAISVSELIEGEKAFAALASMLDAAGAAA